MQKEAKPEQLSLPFKHTWETEGVPLLTLLVTLTVPPDTHPHIRDYYTTMAVCLMHHCEGYLLPRLISLWTADTDPRKRFTHRRTTLRLDCVGRITGEQLVVTRTVTSHGPLPSRTTCVVEHFRLRDGMILPPKRT